MSKNLWTVIALTLVQVGFLICAYRQDSLALIIWVSVMFGVNAASVVVVYVLERAK